MGGLGMDLVHWPFLGCFYIPSLSLGCLTGPDKNQQICPRLLDTRGAPQPLVPPGSDFLYRAEIT